MAEENNTQATEGTTQTQSTPSTGSGKTFTQDEVNKIVEERLKRAKLVANENDLDALKAKAAKWDEQQEAGKSELERQTERADKAEKELEALKLDAQKREWANEVATETKVPASILRGNSKEEMEAHAKDILSSGLSSYGNVKDGGEVSPAPVTKKSILQIKDEAERRKAIAAHIDLF